MSFDGILIGLCSFLVIGLFHPVVIKVEYYWSKKAWPVFLIVGILLIIASLWIRPMVAAAVVGMTGFTCLWSIKELQEQETRVEKGWFPRNPNRDKTVAGTAEEGERDRQYKTTKEESPMEMRRKDLAVTDPARIDEIILNCDCCRLAFADGVHPYIVPLSFGYERRGDAQIFYFHGAAVGRKVELIRRLGYAGFELDRDGTVNPSDKACDFSVRYQSVIGEGDIAEVTDPAEKAQVLQIIMKQYSGRDDWEFPEAVLAKTGVFRLTVKELSAREHG